MLGSAVSTTPILDLQEAPPKPRAGWIPTLIGLAIGFGICFLPAVTGMLRTTFRWPAVNLLLVIPALYVAITAHELGHLAAGRLAGMDAGGISIGAFILVKSGKNWIFRFERKRWLGGFLMPLTPPGDCRARQFAWFLAGGPLASFAFAALAWLLWARAGDGVWDWAGTLLWLSGSMALLTGVPYSSGLAKADCVRLWQFLRHPDAARRWMARVALQTEDVRGVRPRDWNAELFERALAGNTRGGEYVSGQVRAYYRSLDEGRDEAAVHHLENALRESAVSGKAVRHGLFLEAAWASAGIRQQAGQAREWRDRACKVQAPQSLHAVEAAIAMCEGRYEDAEREWQEARAYLERKRLDSGSCRFAKERWAGFEQECRAARAKDNLGHE